MEGLTNGLFQIIQANLNAAQQTNFKNTQQNNTLNKELQDAKNMATCLQATNEKLGTDILQLRNQYSSHISEQKDYTQKVQHHCFDLESRLTAANRDIMVNSDK